MEPRGFNPWSHAAPTVRRSAPSRWRLLAGPFAASEVLAVVHTGKPRLLAPSGLDIAEPGIEREVLRHGDIRVELDRRQAAAARLGLGGDSAGGNNGTVYGASTVAGKDGDALSFDETDDYVAIPDVEMNDTFTITFTAVNDEPTVANPIGQVNADEDDPDTMITLSNVFDDVDLNTEGDTLTFSVEGNDNPGLVTASIDNGDLVLALAPDMSGNATITVRATDKEDEIVDDTFTLVVAAAVIPSGLISLAVLARAYIVGLRERIAARDHALTS